MYVGVELWAQVSEGHILGFRKKLASSSANNLSTPILNTVCLLNDMKQSLVLPLPKLKRRFI